MPTSANSSSDAKLLSDLQKFAASAGIPFPASQQPSSAPPPTPAADTSSPKSTTAAPVSNAGTGNAAVDRCLAAYAEDCRKRIASGQAKVRAELDAKPAYKRAMPPLVGPQNIADFIACVTRGAIEDLLYPEEVTRFLYAAQVANCVKNPNTLPAPKRPRGRPGTAQNAIPQATQPNNSSVNTPDEN